jgi:multiple sugar transport system substrate-binding protein
MPNALTFDAVYDYGIKDPHFVLGPKIPEANEYYSIMAQETQQHAGQPEASPEETAGALKEQLDFLNDV